MRAKLRLVLAARAFAAESIGLNAGRASRRTAVSIATPSCSCCRAPTATGSCRYTWWFPVVGRVPYKGYFDFDERAARSARSTRAASTRVSAPVVGVQHARLVQRSAAADRRSARLARPREHGDPRAHAQHLLRAGRRRLQRVVRQLRRGAWRRVVLPDSWPARGGRGSRGALGRREAPRPLLGGAVRVRWTPPSRRIPARTPARWPTASPRARRCSRRRARRSCTTSGRSSARSAPLALERVRLDNAVLMARRVYLTDLDVFDAVLAKDGGDLDAPWRTSSTRRSRTGRRSRSMP